MLLEAEARGAAAEAKARRRARESSGGGAPLDGRYLLEREVGRGGMGSVHAALDHESGRRVALKVIRPDRVAAVGEPLFRAEFEALLRLTHPGLCRVFDFGSAADGSVYYTQELVDGPDLAEAFRGCREGSEEARAAAFEALHRRLAELLSVLAYVHDEGVVHHDIKPTNVLCPERGPVKLIDFGLASERRARSAPSGSASSGTSGGTLAYAAPERIEGRAGDRRSDLYSLGATLYEVVTGHPPFAGSARRVLRAQIAEAPVSTREANPAVPLRLDRVILRLLRKSPEARFDSAVEVARALRIPVSAERLGGRVEAPLLDTGFQGRAKELKRALAHLRPARLAIGPAVLLVTGEVGVGKSTLVRRVAQRAQVRGFRVRALGPLVSASLGPADVRARADALGAVAGQGPLLLVADELDRLGPSRSWALAEVVRRTLATPAGRRVAVILAATDPARLEAPLADLLADLDGRARLGRLALEPLAASGVERMVACALGVSAQSDQLRRRRLVGQLAQKLREHVGGNPLWVSEALRDWKQRGFLKPRRPGRGRPKLLEPPRLLSVDAAVKDRLAGLPAEALALLPVLAAHDGPCPVPRLLAAAAGGGQAPALLRLEAVGLVRIALDGAGRQRASWARQAFEGAVQAALGPQAIRAAHDALRALLEGDDPSVRRCSSERAADLLRRARHGLLGSEPSRFAPLGLGSSCLLRGMGRLHEAERLLRLALEHTGADRPALRSALLEEQARVIDLRGDAMRARELFLAAIAALGDNGPRHAAVRVRLAIGLSLRRSGRLPEARAQLASATRDAGKLGRRGYVSAGLLALAVVAGDRGRRRSASALLDAAALTLARGGGRRGCKVRSQVLHLRGALCEKNGNLDGAFAAYRDALGLAARGRDEIAKAAMLMDLASVVQRRGQRRLAATLARVATRRATASDALPVLAAVLYRRAAAAWREGRVALARRLFGRAAKVFEATRDQVGEIRSAANEAHAALECGRLGDALRGFQRAVADAAALGRRGMLADARVGLALAASAAGDLEAASRAIEGARLLGAEATPRQRAELLEAEALLLDERTEYGEAVRLGEEAMALRAQQPDSHDGAWAMLAHAERLVRLRDLPAARRVLAEARGLARKLGTRRLKSRAAYVAGLIALEEKRADRALRWLLKGLASLRADPERAWRLHAEAGRAYEALQEAALGLAHRARARRTVEQLQETLAPEMHGAFSRRRGIQRLLLEPVEQLPAPQSAKPTPSPLADLTDTLLKVNRAIVAERDLGRLLELILDGAIALTGAERGFLLMRGRKGRMRFKVGRDIARDDLRKGAQKISQSIAEQVLERGVSVVVADAAGDDRFAARRSVADLGLASIVCVPLALRGETLGVIYLDHRFKREAFGDGARRAAEALADQAAVALENARLFEENAKHRERLERQKEALEVSVERRDLQIAEYQRTLEDVRLPKHRYEEFAGRSRPMLALLTQLDRASAVAYPVLLTGESGVGKELCARAIHRYSARRGRPFVVENSAAVPEGLIEAELFGAVRGAFTGAHDRVGLLEAADGGTLFLDEIGDMSASMQAKLLRVIEQGEVRPLGAERARKVDVRIVAATNKDLAEEVRRGRFREDLYYRLRVLEVRVPPLRDRRDDVAALAERLFKELQQKGDNRTFRLSPEALHALERYSWPGNVRQLRNELLRAVTLTATGQVEISHLSGDVQRGAGPTEAGTGLPGEVRLDDSALGRAAVDAERRILLEALERCGQNRTRCAELLGISRFGLQKRLKRCGIPLKRARRRAAAK